MSQPNRIERHRILHPSLYDGVEVAGVRDCGPDLGLPAGNTCCERDDANPSFWSVYLHLVRGGVECVGDFDTPQGAIRAAMDLAWELGLPRPDFSQGGMPSPLPYLPPYANRTCLLVLEGGRVSLWTDVDGDYCFVQSTAVSATTPNLPTYDPLAYLVADLQLAIRSGAAIEATWREVDTKRRTPRALDLPGLIRTVLWGTQSTPSYHHAARSTQLALEVALTSLNPVRAQYARLRQEERGRDR